jgi:hypothetical protein
MKERIQVKGKRYRYYVGISFIGVREMPIRNEAGLRFVAPRPDNVDRKQIRAEILKRIGA